MGEGGREGDWHCNGCRNRNYAFRSLCNRCKQPRILFDTITPSHSKWLPRFGDWICTGCTNNNYASREKCKKCGEPKEVAAMPAIAMQGAFPTYQHYVVRAQGGHEQKMNFGLYRNGFLQQSHPFSSNRLIGGADKYGLQSASTWPLGGGHTPYPYPCASNASPPLVLQKGWRNGDWICNCGFHNYSSRAQCKKCDASLPPAMGLKRLASEELSHDQMNKRLNSGTVANQFMVLYPGFEHAPGPGGDQKSGLYPAYSYPISASPSNLPVQMQLTHHVKAPTLVGKGANQWRNGDWICTNCDNHNYASRSNCNRCKTLREALPLPVTLVSPDNFYLQTLI